MFSETVVFFNLAAYLSLVNSNRPNIKSQLLTSLICKLLI